MAMIGYPGVEYSSPGLQLSTLLMSYVVFMFRL